jgi:hypothetical protein
MHVLYRADAGKLLESLKASIGGLSASILMQYNLTTYFSQPSPYVPKYSEYLTGKLPFMRGRVHHRTPDHQFQDLQTSITCLQLYMRLDVEEYRYWSNQIGHFDS